jgi:hypothetical protein
METSLIEQLDRSRYNLIKWLTVGWIAWFGTYILKDLIDNDLIVLQFLIAFVGLIGFLFFVINLQKYIRLASKVKNSRLNDALNNELHELYKYKSAYFGFMVLLWTISLFFVLSLFHQISAKFVCEITLYLGVSSSLIAGLIYNKG